MGHRVPSPRELAVHTQSIIQNALLKKKLEEQRENYRKRQEQQQHQHHQQQRPASPAIPKQQQTHSPTPLAFTPTSVLRKMTAEKEPEGAMLTCSQLELLAGKSPKLPLAQRRIKSQQHKPAALKPKYSRAAGEEKSKSSGVSGGVVIEKIVEGVYDANNNVGDKGSGCEVDGRNEIVGGVNLLEGFFFRNVPNGNGIVGGVN